MKKLGQRTESI